MTRLIKRPPRYQPPLPTLKRTELPLPPQVDDNKLQYLIQLGLPLITLFAYVGLALSGQRNSGLLIPMAVTVVASFALGLYGFIRKLLKERRMNRAYRERIRKAAQECQNDQVAQRLYYNFCYPTIDELYLMLENAIRDQSPLRVWERKPDHHDFGALSPGRGTQTSRRTFTLPNEYEAGDPRLAPAIELSELSQKVPDIPVTIHLRPSLSLNTDHEQIQPGCHVLGIAGRHTYVHNNVRAMLMQIATLHAPTDLKLFVATSPSTQTNWKWISALPHARPTTYGVGSRSSSALHIGTKSVYELFNKIKAELNNRQKLLEDHQTGATILPFLVLVIDITGIDGHEFFNSLQKLPVLDTIFTDGQDLGAAVIIVASNRDDLPSECTGVVEFYVKEGIPHFRYLETTLNGQSYQGIALYAESSRAEDEFSPVMSRFRLPETYSSALPDTLGFFEMFGVKRVEEMNIAEHWKQSLIYEQTDWLEVPIGVRKGGDIRTLKFSANGDGNHAMIAGMTGAGKSELLLTLIASLASRYDPTVLNFVLVDYKSGSAFAPIEHLPHVVDVLSNLTPSAAIRAFTAFKAEIDRRGKLMADYKCTDIIEYRRQGLHLKHDMPFLFIIIDEFAELVREHPDFRSRLENITRLGRSLGVHLILATQQPAGVINDQIRANIKLVISLRMQNKDESREVLGKADAAYLPTNVSGRAYVKVGQEELELIQVAHSGAVFVDQSEIDEPAIIWHGAAQMNAS